MPLTPSDVEHKLFGRQLRGYSVEEVDAFCDEVEGELRRLLTDNAELTRRLRVTPPDPAADPLQSALRTLQMAERTAGQTVSAATTEADRIVHEAGEHSTRVLAGLVEEQARAQAQLARLRAFEQECRERIRAYLQAQLRELGDTTPADRTASSEPAAGAGP